MRTLPVPPELKQAIAAAILEDDASPNGEHLFDGERIIFYCPMQGHGLPCDGRSRVPVRELLPPEVRMPAFADHLAAVRPGAALGDLSAAERTSLQRDWEREALAHLAAALPDAVTVRD